MSVRWKDKTNIGTVVAADKLPITKNDDLVDYHVTPVELSTYMETSLAGTFDASGAAAAAVAAHEAAVDPHPQYLTEAEGNAAYQPLDAGLTDIAGLAVTDGNIIVGDGANWVAESGATARTSLGLGTTDSPQFTNLTQTGYHDLTEIAEPASPSANVARVFSFDDAGITKLAYKDSAGAVREFRAGIVSIKDFGATGDGATDDYVAVQAACDYASTNNALIWAPPGTYLLSDRLYVPSPTTPWGMVGAHRDLVIFRKTTADTDSVMEVREINGGYFAEFTLDGNFDSLGEGNHGLVVYNCENVLVRRVKVMDHENTGILVFNDDLQAYLNVVVEDCEVDGLGVANNGISIVDHDQSGMRGCLVRNCPGSPGYGLQLKENNNHSFIENCVVEGCVAGIALAGDSTYVRVNDVIAKACNYGIQTGLLTYSSVSHVVIDMTGAANPLDSVDLQNNSNYNTFTNIASHNVSSNREAIRFEDNSSDNYVHFSYVDKALGNLVGIDSGSTRNSVHIDKTADNFTAINNKIRDDSGVTTNKISYLNGKEWVVAGTYTYSTDVTGVDFADLGMFDEVFVLLANITTSSSVTLLFRVSVNNGSSFLSTSGDYNEPTSTGIQNSQTAAILHNTAATAGRSCSVHVFGMRSGQIKPYSLPIRGRGGYINTTSALNAVRVDGAGANITGGSIIVYGR